MPELTPLDDNRQEHFLNGEDLEPITRREHFYAGRESELPEGHQEPETREEWFIQKYRGGGGDVTVVPLSVTENGTYSEEGKAYSPVSVNVPLPQNAYLLKSIANLPQAIASFNDGEEMVMPSLKVAIEPQQDLHGYDAPWVGGAGKNKFDSDTVLSAFTKNNNKYVGMPSSIVNDYVISGGFKTNTRYTLSYKAYNNTSTPSNFRFVFSYTDGTEEIIGGFVDTTTEKVIVGTSAENKTISKIKRNYGNGVEITLYDIQLEEGTTATTFAPYSNICPISGWDEVDVSVCGKNLLDPNITGTDGYYDDNGEYHTSQNTGYYGPISVGASTQYSAKLYAPKWTEQGGATATFAVYFFDTNNNWISRQRINIGQTSVSGYTNTLTFTTPATCSKIYLQAPNGNAVSTQLDLSQSVVTLGNVADYVPYQGTTYTIDLDGTRYGGEVDVVNGIVTPAPYYASYNGEALTGEWISDRDKYEVGATPTIGAQVVNIGASGTPVSILPTAIKSLRGVNNVYANTGDIKDAEYFSKEV